MLILFCSVQFLYAQNIVSERKNIIGKWKAEEGTWTLEFSKTTCKEYFENKLDATYSYSITPAKSYCGIKAEVDLKDTTISFLQLKNLVDQKITCFEINGVSDKNLVLWRIMLAQPSVFIRMK